MPVIAILLGIVLIDLALRGTEHEFAQQLSEDFSGGNFWAWLAAISIIGAIGYYEPAKRVSNLGIALVVLAMILANEKQNGIFAKFSALFTSPPQPAASVPLPKWTGSSSSSSGSGSSLSALSSLGGGGGGSTVGTVAEYAAIAGAL